MQCHRRLDQARHTRGRIQMPDIRFDRPDPAMPDLVACCLKGLRKGRNLNRVAQICPRSVAFHVVNRIGSHVGNRMRLCNRF